MRILKLELERYGHFTGKSLEFRPDAALHVVYGPNEAGKTSSLDAITDLLFGFGARTTYNFVHENNALLLGATIADRAGHTLSFKRRKGKGLSKTILDPNMAVLPDDSLAPYLGMVDRGVFLNSWGLSKESLRAGAEEMLKSGGEAGSSLFAAASGLKGLMELQRRLDTEASAIFAPTKAQHRTFYQARDRFEAAAKQIRTLELAARDLKERRAQIASLNEELTTIRYERAEFIKRREFLVRQQEIAPILGMIAADEDRLSSWENLPMMEASRVHQLRRALSGWEAAQIELDRLRREEATEKLTFESYVVDSPLLEIGPVIVQLVSESGNYASQKGQCPRVQSEADGFKGELADLASQLGLPPETDLVSIRPNKLLLTRVTEQIEAGKEVAANLASNAASTHKEKTALEVLRKQQPIRNSVGDPAPLRESLSRLMPALGHLPEIQRLERATATQAKQIREKAAQLSPSVPDLDALAQVALPSKEVIDEYAQFRAALDGELSVLQASLREVARILPGLQAKVNELANEHLDASPERIAAVRSDRSGHWLPLRSMLLNETDPLPVGETAIHVIGLEETTSAADRLADDAVQNADRLASHAAALKRFSEETSKHSEIDGLLAAKQREIAVHQDSWQALWRPLGLEATPPLRMASWLNQVRDLLDRREALNEERQQLTQLLNTVNEIRPLLNSLAASVGIQGCEELPVNLLLQAVEAALNQRADAWRKSSDLNTRLKAVEERIEALEEEKESLLAVEQAWKTNWADILTSMGLPPTTNIDGAAEALDIWRQVPATLKQHDDRLRRVKGMKRDMNDFEERSTALLRKLGEPDLGLGADAAIKVIAERLLAAQKVATKAGMAQERYRALTAKVAVAAGQESAAAVELEALCAVLPPSASRAEQITALEEREAVLERLRGRRQTLLPLSRGQSEAELRQSLEAFDATLGAAEIEELKSKESQHSQRENETFAKLKRAEDELSDREAGVGAEIALQMRKNAEAELIQDTRAWTVKRFAQILLAHAIEQHRSQQEQPLLRRASQLFSLLTEQSFTGIDQVFDEDDAVLLVGRRDAEHTITVPEMSEGTRDQLYFALRLAFLEEYAQNAEPMPFIGDDLLTSFDDERTLQGLAALAATGTLIQAILFTHHSKVVELAQASLGARVDVINLNN